MLVSIISIKSATGSSEMNVFHKYIKDNSGDLQIKRPKSCLYGSYLVGSAIFLGALLSKTDRVMWFCISLLVLLLGVLSFKNDRVEFDEVGITFFNIWGKPYSKTWDEVRNVEVLVEPLISRQYVVGPVLKIQCTDQKKNKYAVTTYRFPYKYYIGIEGFLSFYQQIISRES